MDKKAFIKLGKYLRQKRLSKGISQVSIAKELGYKSQFVANWERGVSSPPMDSLKKIVEYYGIQQKEFLNIMDEIQKDFLKRNIFSSKNRRD